MDAFAPRLARSLGLHHLFRLLRRSKLTVLRYHGVSPRLSQGVFDYRKRFIDPLVFARQMEYLKRKYTILPLEEAVERSLDGTLPPYALAVTFDGGYRNTYTYAFPVLRAHSVPATVFVSTSFVGSRTPRWEDRIEHAVGVSSHGKGTPPEEKTSSIDRLRSLLSKYDADKREARVRELERAAGASIGDFSGDGAPYAPLSWEECRMMRPWRIAIGSCGRTESALALLEPEEERAEIADARAEIEREIGAVSRVYAYPGEEKRAPSERTKATLEREGFLAALTSSSGANGKSADRYALKRISMDGTEDETAFLLTVSGVRGTLG